MTDGQIAIALLLMAGLAFFAGYHVGALVEVLRQWNVARDVRRLHMHAGPGFTNLLQFVPGEIVDGESDFLLENDFDDDDL